MIKQLVSKYRSTRNRYQEAQELGRLRRLPRFNDFETMIHSRKIVGPDAASFVFMYKEILNERIYSFSPSNDQPLILDCGANIGLSTIFFKETFPNARVLAFEPDPKICSFLRQNIANFELKNVEVFEYAVWKETTNLTFLSEGADGGRVQKKDDTKSIVHIKALDILDFVNEKIDLLKMDIEGSELIVLERLSSKLQMIDNFFIEYHSFGRESQELDKILALLSNHGFRYHISCPSMRAKQPLKAIPVIHGMDMMLNIYASKKPNLVYIS